MEEKELWMNKLKEKLDDYEESVPVSSWEQLEKELVPLSKKDIFLWRRWQTAVAAGLLLLLLSSVSLYFLRTPVADEIRTVSSRMAFVPDMLPAVNQSDVLGTVVVPALRMGDSKEVLAKVGYHHPVSVYEKAEHAVVSVSAVAEEERSVADDVVDDKKNDEEQVSSVERKKSSRVPSGKDKYHLPEPSVNTKKGTWSVGVAVGNSGSVSSGTETVGRQYSMSRVNMVSVTDGLMEIPNNQTLVFDDGVPYLSRVRVAGIKHHQPISFGISVRRSLTKGFSLETGVVYTLLSSDVELVEDSRRVDQNLHYLGIPLRANWNFLEHRFISFYVSGGGMVEKCVYGKVGSEKEVVNPLQYSISGAVGAQLNATKHVGLYVEPGVSYYFKDGSEIQTIRKENPFNFNMQAGIRLTY